MEKRTSQQDGDWRNPEEPRSLDQNHSNWTDRVPVDSSPGRLVNSRSSSQDWRRISQSSIEEPSFQVLERRRNPSSPITRTTMIHPPRQIRPPSLSPPSSGEDSDLRFSFDHSSLLLPDLPGGRGRLLSISEEVATSTPRLCTDVLPPLNTLTPSTSPVIDEGVSREDGTRTGSPESSLELRGSEDSKDSNPRFKTEICRNFKEKGSCLYGHECQFAHGYDEMRDAGKQNKYKTKLCQKYWIAGYCAYGPRCNFLHNEEGETQVKQINSIEDNIGESFELPSPSLSSSTARGMVRIPPLSSLLWPQYGSGRLAAFPHNDGLAWVDTRTNTIV